MGTWIFSELVILFFSYVIWMCFHAHEGLLVYFIDAILLSVIFIWPVHWAANQWVMDQEEYKGDVAAHRAEWYTNMNAKGCKRTGFVGVGGGRSSTGYITGIWTCPDGVAYLEPHYND